MGTWAFHNAIFIFTFFLLSFGIGAFFGYQVGYAKARERVDSPSNQVTD